MSELKLSGTVYKINETQVVSDKFSKREFVLCDNGMYPQHVQFEVINDKCPELDRLAVGSDIEVYFNLRGREWTNPQGETKYFNTLQAWKIETATEAYAPTEATPNEEDDDLLPF